MEKKNISTAIILVVVVIAVGLGIYIWSSRMPTAIGGEKDAHGCLVAAGYSWCEARNACERSWEQYCTSAATKVAVFNCEGGKSISATFYPSDDKYVDLVLSDERSISLPHTISASGARYARENESMVFWNKGNTAFVTEFGSTTFANCVTNG